MARVVRKDATVLKYLNVLFLYHQVKNIPLLMVGFSRFEWRQLNILSRNNVDNCQVLFNFDNGIETDTYGRYKDIPIYLDESLDNDNSYIGDMEYMEAELHTNRDRNEHPERFLTQTQEYRGEAIEATVRGTRNPNRLRAVNNVPQPVQPMWITHDELTNATGNRG